MSAGWIGVDLDGTLAEGHATKIGVPIAPMLDRVRAWVAAGVEVRIVTARAADPLDSFAVSEWLARWGIPGLTITDRKDYQMLELWDDRAVRVVNGDPCCSKALATAAKAVGIIEYLERRPCVTETGWLDALAQIKTLLVPIP